MQQKISDAAQAGLNPKERKKAVKNRIKKQKIALLRSLKRVSMYLALQCAATIPQAGNTLLGTQAATTGKIPGEAVMSEMNARAQVDDALQKRREWLIKEKLFAKLVQYQNIVKAKSGMDKKNYIKKHFFDVVYPRGGIPKGSNYCVASVMRCLYDVNQETGDLERFMPDGNTTEGHSMVSCPMFKQYVKKNFPDCIIEKPTKADKANLEEGDIILSRSSRNTSSGLHLTAVYNSREGIEISFNSEGIRPYKTENIETIIKLGKIIDTCLQERIRQMDPRSALASLEAGVKNNDFQMTTLAMAKASGRRNVSM
jgi:hypothetical protein